MRNLRTEDEIIANWKSDIDQPVVSICCITYNHQPYIEDALEGFLIQETDFPFEILIHDDASTDRTADIIREYQAKYPRLIKPIYQTENQYSKGLKMNPTFNFPRAKGKFIALCEGDDKWINRNKLQIQLDCMRKYRWIDISFHKAVLKGHGREEIISDNGEKIKIIPSRNVLIKGGGFMPTSTIIFRSDVLNNTLLNDLLKISKVGDYVVQCIASRENGALYLPYEFSVYNFSTPSSYSKRHHETTNQLERAIIRSKLKIKLAYLLKYKLTSKLAVVNHGAIDIVKSLIRLIIENNGILKSKEKSN